MEQKTDQIIENAPLPDPTAEEAQRALALLDQGAGTDPVKTAAAEPEKKLIEHLADPRDAISANWRTSRQAKPADTLVDPNNLAAVYGTDIIKTVEAAPAAAAPAPAQAALDSFVTLKVNGVEKTMTVADAVALAQKNDSADRRLSEATRLLNEAKTVQPAPIKADSGEDRPGEPSPSIDKPAKPSIPTGTKFDRGLLTKAAEAITLGTTEEGADALGELLEKVAQPAPSVDISNQVEDALAARDLKTESTEATQAFLAKYPDLATDDILQQVSGKLVADEMLKDFIAAGLTPEVIAKAMPTVAHVKHYHDALRTKDRGFGRPMKALMTAAEADPRFQKLTSGQTQPLTVNVDRADRKAAVPSQPALRSPPPLPAQQDAAQSRTAGMSRAVQQMQESRGQRISA